MKTEYDRRYGKKSQLRLHARRKKKNGNKGRKRCIINNRIRFLKHNDPRIAIYSATNRNDCVIENDANLNNEVRTTSQKTTGSTDALAECNTCDVQNIANEDAGCSHWYSTPEKVSGTTKEQEEFMQESCSSDISDIIYDPEFSNDIATLPITPTKDSSEKNDCLVEMETRKSEDNVIDAAQTLQGRRIFDINALFSQISRISKHNKMFECSFSNMHLVKEERRGMQSIFYFQCSMCGTIETLDSENSDSSSQMNINDAWVSSMLTTGQGFTQMRDISSTLEIPCMAKETFQRHQRTLSSVLHDAAWQEMEAAGKEEADLARSDGFVDENGTPVITVVTDVAWCKRSFGTNYNALSGVACIIGARSKKILFASTRNAYCCICARYAAKKEQPREHVCFKNWSKPSTAMEADIIVEGFKNSTAMHNLKYGQIIGDGDSSVMAQLTKAQPYGPHFMITKIECCNHILRNYLRRLRDVSKKTTNAAGPVPVAVRRVLSGDKQLRLRAAVTGAIKYRGGQTDLNLQEKIDELKKDILNGPFHVFGDHSKCGDRGYFCKGPKEGENNLVPDLKAVGVWDEILSARNLVACHSSSLIHNVSTNMAESFNSVLCKYVSGKRVNHSLRGGYIIRCNLSVIDVNTSGRTQSIIHKSITNSSPGKICKRNIERKQKSASKRRQRLEGKPKKVKRKRLTMSGPDCHYGLDENRPDLSSSEFEERKTKFLNSLALNEEGRNALQANTTSQVNCGLWRAERHKRLTASSFARICKMKKSTLRAKTVISLLYSDFRGTKATRYGQEKEPIAKQNLEIHIGKKVKEAGLFVDKDLPWLAATPDGIIDDDTIVEIKCPASAENLTPQDAIARKKITCCSIEYGEMKLKENHDFMFQVQGQLHITQKNFCYFVIWTPNGMLTELIAKNDNFWETKMVHQLTNFYMEYLLPEIIDPRYPRNLPIRENK